MCRGRRRRHVSNLLDRRQADRILEGHRGDGALRGATGRLRRGFAVGRTGGAYRRALGLPQVGRVAQCRGLRARHQGNRATGPEHQAHAAPARSGPDRGRRGGRKHRSVLERDGQDQPHARLGCEPLNVAVAQSLRLVRVLSALSVRKDEAKTQDLWPRARQRTAREALKLPGLAAESTGDCRVRTGTWLACRLAAAGLMAGIGCGPSGPCRRPIHAARACRSSCRGPASDSG